MQREKSIIALLESRRVHGNRFGLTIRKDNPASPIEFNLHTASNKSKVISAINREECLARHESRETYYTNLRTSMAISCARFLPIWNIPVPVLDGSHTVLFLMRPEEWYIEWIVCSE